MIRKILFSVLLIISSCHLPEEQEQKSEIQRISEEITKNPVDISLLYARVDYNRLEGNLESALYDLKEIVRLDSLDAINHYNIAEIYFELSKSNNRKSKYPSLVRYHLEKSLKIDDKNSSAYALMGELLLAYYEYEDAIKLFNLSLKLEYNQERTHMLMGYAFKQLGNSKNAIDCFRNSVNINPDFIESHIQLGQIFHLLKDTTALIYYSNALDLDSSNEIVLYNRALFFQNQLEWNKALDAYADLHNVYPFHGDGHYNLGFIHMELKLYDIAVNNFSDAIYSNPNFYEAYYSRGNCFETLGNVKQAESDYKRAVEINPEYTYAIQALEDLIEKNRIYNK
tara:strand:- start:1938 stop:2957 length:1020 start_codon:yes stop_codon:yes gene_type:complete